MTADLKQGEAAFADLQGKLAAAEETAAAWRRELTEARAQAEARTQAEARVKRQLLEELEAKANLRDELARARADGEVARQVLAAAQAGEGTRTAQTQALAAERQQGAARLAEALGALEVLQRQCDDASAIKAATATALGEARASLAAREVELSAAREALAVARQGADDVRRADALTAAVRADLQKANAAKEAARGEVLDLKDELAAKVAEYDPPPPHTSSLHSCQVALTRWYPPDR